MTATTELNTPLLEAAREEDEGDKTSSAARDDENAANNANYNSAAVTSLGDIQSDETVFAQEQSSAPNPPPPDQRRRRRWLFPSSSTRGTGDVDGRPANTTTPTEPSLAWAPTTHWLAKLCIPLLILYTHRLFWYGQTRDMWRLTAHWQANLSYTATTAETRSALDILNLPTFGTIDVEPRDKTMRTFTYLYAIQELWRARHMPGVFLPRLAAAGLMLFSGVWPHVKLFMLLMTWWFAKQPVRRRRCLTSLAVLGKWSLVDVLVVCVMVGVLNLQWHFTGESLSNGIQSHLPAVVSLVHSLYNATDLCSLALHYDCTSPSKATHMFACKACRRSVNDWFDRPESAAGILKGLNVTGNGRASLSVAGLSGIYSFCAAVILSILLSVVVDWYDHQSRRRRWREEQQQQRLQEDYESSSNATPELVSETNSIAGNDELDVNDPENNMSALLHHPLLLPRPGTGGGSSILQTGDRDVRSAADMDFDRRILVDGQQYAHGVWTVLAWITAGVVLAATSTITLDRRVYGALPQLLHDILSVQFTRHYSFWALGWTTAFAGGWDRLLCATFVWFVIVGPLVRCILCLVASRTIVTSNLSLRAVTRIQRRQRRLSNAIDFVGAFCAWEVFTVAVCMVDLLMPSITSTILLDKHCAQIAQQAGDTTCLKVAFDTKPTFGLVIVGGFMLVLVSRRMRLIQAQT